MSKQVINIGSSPNDKTGDKLRDAMNKVNLNFTELYSLTGSTSGSGTSGSSGSSGTSGSGSSGSSGTSGSGSSGSSGTSGTNGKSWLGFYNYSGVTSGSTLPDIPWEAPAGWIVSDNSILRDITMIYLSEVDLDGYCHEDIHCSGSDSWFNNILFNNLATITFQNDTMWVSYHIHNYDGSGRFVTTFRGSNVSGATLADIGVGRIYTSIQGDSGTSGSSGSSGTSGTSPSGMTLSQLNDVNLTGLTSNQYLAYDGANWYNTPAGLSGTSSFWVSSLSGGTADTQLIFINGILVSRI